MVDSQEKRRQCHREELWFEEQAPSLKEPRRQPCRASNDKTNRTPTRNLLGQVTKEQTCTKDPESAKEPGQQNARWKKTEQNCEHIYLNRTPDLGPGISIVLKEEWKARPKLPSSGVSDQVGVVARRRLIHVETWRVIPNPGGVEGKK